MISKKPDDNVLKRANFLNIDEYNKIDHCTENIETYNLFCLKILSHLYKIINCLKFLNKIFLALIIII